MLPGCSYESCGQNGCEFFNETKPFLQWMNFGVLTSSSFSMHSLRITSFELFYVTGLLSIAYLAVFFRPLSLIILRVSITQEDSNHTSEVISGARQSSSRFFDLNILYTSSHTQQYMCQLDQQHLIKIHISSSPANTSHLLKLLLKLISLPSFGCH